MRGPPRGARPMAVMLWHDVTVCLLSLSLHRAVSAAEAAAKGPTKSAPEAWPDLESHQLALHHTHRTSGHAPLQGLGPLLGERGGRATTAGPP
ncbi:MAG: hypothetical protein J3K34DRAFT_408731 [Monoraphidium minutum]|nr:MAG: hypothetical protein J3K34DRAFT_408731 [Monoraphidium minutum]